MEVDTQPLKRKYDDISELPSATTNGRTSNGATADLPQPRLLIDVVSKHAAQNPQKIWGALPKDATDASKGYEDITFGRLNYAVNRAARWLEDTLGDKRRCAFESLAYMGPPDSRYVILVLASIKAGFQMLFLSTRNSDEAQYTVMKQADCHKFLCGATMKKRVDALIKNWPNESTGVKSENGLTKSQQDFSDMLVIAVPEQEDLLLDVSVPDFPYRKTLEDARKDPLVTLHTSSTTGMPKTIPLNQGYGLYEDIVQHIPGAKGLDIITRKPFYGRCRMFVAMPLFHAGGVLLTLLKSLYHDIVAVFQPPGVQLSATVFDSIIRYGKCTGCVIPPSLLEEMLAVPSYFDTLAGLDFVQFGSGPLSKVSGDLLLTRQKNCPHYIGSSECGLYTMLELDDPVADWQYFHFHPTWSGIDMRPLDGDGKNFEMFVVRLDNKTPGLQPVFELFPELDEWPTRDMYVQHPTKPYLWRCIGRVDDVMVLSNGEKLNPIDMEGHIANTIPEVVGALVVGQGRFMPGLLLETKGVDARDPTERKKLIERIWPFIQRANKEAPKHAQLTKSLIIFTTPDKPFARTPKLSVRRGPTIQMYAEEISKMFDSFETNLEASNDVDLPENVSLGSSESIENLIMHILKQLTGWQELPGLKDDLFMLGLDSLHVARLTRAIKLVLSRQKTAGKENGMTTKLVYDNPTVDSLAKSLHKLVLADDSESQTNGEISREKKIEDVIAKYTHFEFDSTTFQTVQTNGRTTGRTTRSQYTKPWTIVLTGSTGSLGTYFLATLLQNPLVSQIFCLNRTSTARARQIEALKVQGLPVSSGELKTRVKFLYTKSLSEPLLGLDKSSYNQLLQASPTHIIHNAWPVNFNLSLASFETHIAGVRSLVDFCAQCGSKPPKICFISSLSSVMAMSLHAKVPEKIVLDANCPSPMGYGESKYVAERLLNAATAASGGAISSIIMRVGQIAGPVGWLDAKGKKGLWPMREWLPSLVISSKSIGVLPSTLGRMEEVEWIPVDMLAGVISELIGVVETRSEVDEEEEDDSNINESDVFNLLNPRSVSWQKHLLPAVQGRLNIKQALPLSDWIDRVRDGPDETDGANPNPARKILPFYEGLAAQKKTIPSAESNGATNGDNASGQPATVNASRKSKIFRELEPVKSQWMKTWMDQWKL